MATLPQLIAKNPITTPAKEEEVITTVIPAVEEKIYDKYWVTQFTLLSHSPTEEARIVVQLSPARDVEVDVEGEVVTVKELMPDAEEITFVIDNVFERVDNNENFAMALGATLNALIEVSKEKNLLK